MEYDILPLAAPDVNEAFLIEKSHFSRPLGLDEFKRYTTESFSLSAKLSGKIIGYILCEKVIDELHIIKVATRGEYLRRGVAEALVKKAIENGVSAGAKEVLLEVRASNAAAIGLYKKLGFAGISIRKEYYSDPDEDAVVMRRVL